MAPYMISDTVYNLHKQPFTPLALQVMTKLGHKDAIVLFRPKTLQNKFEASEVIYEGADPVDKWVNANYHGICGVKQHFTLDKYLSHIIIRSGPLTTLLTSRTRW